MDKAFSAKKAAFSLIKQYKLGIPSLDDIVFIIKSYGFDIIDYEFGKGQKSVDSLISELSLQSLASTGKAFTYQRGEIKLVFVCSLMTSEEKRYALAHELGHIVAGHLTSEVYNKANVTEEYEANEIAHYLLHPSIGLKAENWVYRHKSLVIVSLVILLIGIGAVLMRHYSMVEKTYYGEYYVTENGEKYHDEDCIYIKDKSNVHRLTIEEYESGEFEPCRICLDDCLDN